MKYVKVIAVLCMCIFSMLAFTACEDKNAHQDWETPLGYSERIEKGLTLYINEKYQYAVDYPVIFENIESNDEGMSASGEGIKLDIWIEKGGDLPAIMEKLKEEHELTEEYISETALTAVFDEDDTQTYMYKMVEGSYIYSFNFSYPASEKEKYVGYCQNMITYYVVIKSMEEIESERAENGETGETGSEETKITLPEGDNIYESVSSDWEAIDLVRDTYAKDFTLKLENEISYINPDNPGRKLSLSGATDTTYLIKLYDVVNKDDGTTEVNVIDWFTVSLKDGYCVMEPMMETAESE